LIVVALLTIVSQASLCGDENQPSSTEDANRRATDAQAIRDQVNRWATEDQAKTETAYALTPHASSTPAPTFTPTPIPPIIGKIGEPIVVDKIIFTIPELKLDGGVVYVPLEIENNSTELFTVRQLWTGCTLNLLSGDVLAANPNHPNAFRIGPETLASGAALRVPENIVLVFTLPASTSGTMPYGKLECKMQVSVPGGPTFFFFEAGF
jgi:hypothetical protein